MKIAVIGGEGTGKSVLCAALARTLNVPVLEPLRGELLAESGYHTLYEWATATRGWKTLVERQLARESGFPAGVVDGGALEAFSLLQRWGWNTSSPDSVEQLRTQVLALAKTYQQIILLPPRVVAPHASARFRSHSHNLQLVRLLEAALREGDLVGRTLAVADRDEAARSAEALAFVTAR